MGGFDEPRRNKAKKIAGNASKSSSPRGSK
jgi:hypothetical protein